MLKFTLRRLLLMIPTLIGVTFIIFTLIYFTPGDPALAILGETASPIEVDKLREEMGLNDPFIVQYGNYMKKLVVDQDLGSSYRSDMPVAAMIGQAFPYTAKLATLCILIAILLGVPLGLLSAIKRYTLADAVATLFSLFGLSVPVFWFGMMMILIFSVWLKWLPPSGFSTPAQMILPVAALSLQSIAAIMRMTRSSMLEVLQQDYMRTAKAKGLHRAKIILVHGLKNAFIPVLTTIGLQFGNLLSGAVLTESIFSIPGLGRIITDAITTRDSPVIQGTVLVIAVIYCLINLIVDLLYGALDPKIRSSYR